MRRLMGMPRCWHSSLSCSTFIAPSDASVNLSAGAQRPGGLGEGGGSGPRQRLKHGFNRLIAGGDAEIKLTKHITKLDVLERRQRAAVERGGEGGAPDVGDLGAVEIELVELLQSSSRRRRSCSRWRRVCRRRCHEGGEALVAERVATEEEVLQSGPPAQRRREGRKTRVTDGGAVQKEGLEPPAGRLGPGQRRAPRRLRRLRAYRRC